MPTPPTDAPAKQEHEQLKKYCATLERQMRKMDSKLKHMDERLRAAQGAISTLSRRSVRSAT